MVAVFGELFKENLASERKKLFHHMARLFVGIKSITFFARSIFRLYSLLTVPEDE
jgi:hypothetical protein